MFQDDLRLEKLNLDGFDLEEAQQPLLGFDENSFVFWGNLNFFRTFGFSRKSKGNSESLKALRSCPSRSSPSCFNTEIQCHNEKLFIIRDIPKYENIIKYTRNKETLKQN